MGAALARLLRRCAPTPVDNRRARGRLRPGKPGERRYGASACAQATGCAGHWKDDRAARSAALRRQTVEVPRAKARAPVLRRTSGAGRRSVALCAPALAAALRRESGEESQGRQRRGKSPGRFHIRCPYAQSSRSLRSLVGSPGGAPVGVDIRDLMSRAPPLPQVQRLIGKDVAPSGAWLRFASSLGNSGARPVAACRCAPPAVGPQCAGRAAPCGCAPPAGWCTTAPAARCAAPAKWRWDAPPALAVLRQAMGERRARPAPACRCAPPAE